jgi:hypothetical protein
LARWVTAKIERDNGSALVDDVSVVEEAPEEEELAGTEEGQRIFKDMSKAGMGVGYCNVKRWMLVSAELHSTASSLACSP